MISGHSSKPDPDEELQQIVESQTKSILEQFESRMESRFEHIESRVSDLETAVSTTAAL
jgi:hypothetical protein